MYVNRFISKYLFAAKKQLSHTGIIVDPEDFKATSPFQKITNWIRNSNKLGEMERTMKDFKREKSKTFFVNHNNNLLQAIEKANFRDLQTMLNQSLYRTIKTCLKSNQPIPQDFNLFHCNKATILQARSFTQPVIRLKSIDTWYQLILEYQNTQNNKKVYHAVQRFHKQKQWKFIKFNL